MGVDCENEIDENSSNNRPEPEAASIAGGAVGLMLRSLATGLPVSYLASPSELRLKWPARPLYSQPGRGTLLMLIVQERERVENNPILDTTRVHFGGNVRSAGVWGELPRALKRHMAFFIMHLGAAHPEFRTTLSSQLRKNDAGNGKSFCPQCCLSWGMIAYRHCKRSHFPLVEVITFGGQPPRAKAVEISLCSKKKAP